MWPFERRQSREGYIDLDDLKDITEANPVKTYTNLLLLHMADHDIRELTLRQSSPLPVPELWQFQETPDLKPVINRLKIMSNLDPVIYPEIKHSRIQMWVRSLGEITIHTSFDDTAEDPSVQLRMEPNPASK